MTRLEALVGLNMVSDIGTIRLNRLLGYFGRPQDILAAPIEKLTAVSGIGEKIAAQIRSFTAKDLEKEFTALKKKGLQLLTLDDADYPQWLKTIPDPPIILYIKGDFKAEDKFSIAIVGSRRASFYGLSCAEKFAAGLAARGITVVSGMARGIDTSAHKGALKQRGRTIAVIGSGFNNIYPEENARLAEEISRSGAVVSEFCMEMLPLKQNFPRRNRIISGLSMGVLVAEAAENSGALITADFALEQGREVFALPGKVDSATSCGSNGLIKQGAKLVSCVEEILEDFPTCPVAKSQHNRNAAAAPALNTAMQQEEAMVYALIPEEPIELDSLAEKTNMDIPEISGILLKLQLKKLIKQLPGKQFVKEDEK